MKYDVYLSPHAKKQYKKFDIHMRQKIRAKLLELEEDPSEKGSLLYQTLHDNKEYHPQKIPPKITIRQRIKGCNARSETASIPDFS